MNSRQSSSRIRLSGKRQTVAPSGFGTELYACNRRASSAGGRAESKGRRVGDSTWEIAPCWRSTSTPTALTRRWGKPGGARRVGVLLRRYAGRLSHRGAPRGERAPGSARLAILAHPAVRWRLDRATLDRDRLLGDGVCSGQRQHVELPKTRRGPRLRTSGIHEDPPHAISPGGRLIPSRDRFSAAFLRAVGRVLGSSTHQGGERESVAGPSSYGLRRPRHGLADLPGLGRLTRATAALPSASHFQSLTGPPGQPIW